MSRHAGGGRGRVSWNQDLLPEMSPVRTLPGNERATHVALHRSRKHKMIAGVCGGLAEWLGWDPTVVRIVYVLVSVLSAAFPGIIVYVVLWALMPKAPA